ncbi:MAG: SurA N-terminal domain-containing protein [Paracoccaceae bacterium]
MAGGAKGSVSKLFGGGLLLLLVVGLAGFGTANFGGSISSVGKVGDTEIAVSRYSRELTQELAAFEAQTNIRFTMEQARQFGIDRNVLDRLVNQAALEDEAQRAGISTGDASVRDQIVAIPNFQGLDGNFDTEAYRATLRQANLSVSEFEGQIRADLSRNLIQAAVLAGATAPQPQTDLLMAWVGEQRDLAWISLGPNELTDSLGEPSEADLTAYYNAHPDEFTLPAAKNITYAWLSPEMVMDIDAVDDLALRALYQERIADYVTPERRLVERLVFGTEEEAAAARAQIDSDETSFDALVEARGLTLADIDLGDVSQADLGAAGAEVFAAAEPGIIGPVQSDLGPALIRINAILAASEITYDEARDELADEYLADAARRDIEARIDDLDDLLASGATLEELAKEPQFELGTLRWTPDMSEGIAANEEFSEEAAAISADDFPEIRTLFDGGIFAMRLDSEEGPALQPQADVQVAVIQGWEAEETAKRLKEQADALVARLAAGETIDDLGYEVTRVENTQRTGFLDGTPEDMLRDAFAAERGVPLLSSGQIDGSQMIFLTLVEAINAPDPDAPENDRIRASIENQTAQSFGQDVLDAFTGAIRAEVGIEIRQTALNAVHANIP